MFKNLRSCTPEQRALDLVLKAACHCLLRRAAKAVAASERGNGQCLRQEVELHAQPQVRAQRARGLAPLPE